MAHYAWSEIHGGTVEKPVMIARGEEVSKSKLGVSDEEWEALIRGGSVREKKFPAPKDYEGSAVEYLREQMQEATSMSSIDEEEAAGELAKVSDAEGSKNK